ncbi:hypothetical protein DP140_27260, partial [Salmonella enterica subsp. enterica serovar Weltevreden]
FDRLSTRMDEVTAARFGRSVLIDGAEYVAAEASFMAELGALSVDALPAGDSKILSPPEHGLLSGGPVLWAKYNQVCPLPGKR